MGNVCISQNLNVGGKIEAFGILPIGAVISYFGVDTPEGWLLCDGSSFNKETYPELYSVLGNKNQLPNITDGRFLEGSITPNISQDATLPNIKGEVTLKGIDGSRLYIDHVDNQELLGEKNALTGGNSGSEMRVASYKSNSEYKQQKTLVFNAGNYNSIYKDENIVRPMSITTRFLIRAK